MLDIEAIKANWETAVLLAAYNHSIGPIVMQSLDDIPALIAEVERQAKEIEELRESVRDYRR
jgi:hypothetical protein